MKKLPLALAAASALSLGLASAAQAGEGGIAAGAAATFSADGTVESLSVAAAVGKSGAAVSVRSGPAIVLGTELITATNPVVNVNGVSQINQITSEPLFATEVIGTETVLVESTGIVNEASAIGTGGVITANRIGDSTTTTDGEGVTTSTPLPIFTETGDQFLPAAQANNLGNGTANFVVFDPGSGGFVTLVEGNATAIPD